MGRDSEAFQRKKHFSMLLEVTEDFSKSNTLNDILEKSKTRR
jgi:hypothetical protein